MSDQLISAAVQHLSNESVGLREGSQFTQDYLRAHYDAVDMVKHLTPVELIRLAEMLLLSAIKKGDTSAKVIRMIAGPTHSIGIALDTHAHEFPVSQY